MTRSAREKNRKVAGREPGTRRSEPPRGGARVRGADSSLPFTAVNAVFGGAGLLAVIVGYVLLAQGSITAAPILLTLGYAVLLPIAIVR